MLTSDDIKLIEKSFDKKLKPIKVDIDAIQTRVADMETGYASKIDYLEIRNILNRVEKRLAAQETRLSKIESTMVTKSEFKSELKPIKSKLNKLNKFVQSMNRFYDSEVIELGKRTDRIEKHLKLSPSSSVS